MKFNVHNSQLGGLLKCIFDSISRSADSVDLGEGLLRTSGSNKLPGDVDDTGPQVPPAIVLVHSSWQRAYFHCIIALRDLSPFLSPFQLTFSNCTNTNYYKMQTPLTTLLHPNSCFYQF